MRTLRSSVISFAPALALVLPIHLASAQVCDPVEVQKLVASDAGQGDHFGFSVAVLGDVMMVSASALGHPSADSGAYFFRWDGTEWIEEQKVTVFGQVVLDGESAFVCGSSSNRVVVHVYQHNGSRWAATQTITTQIVSLWPASPVAVDGNRMVVGGFNGSEIHRWRNGSWEFEQELVPSDPPDQFGRAVDIEGDRVIVGDLEVDGFKGAAYIYRRANGVWTEEQKIVASDGQITEDYFGAAVQISGDRIMVSAPGHDLGSYSEGAVYVFDWNGASWQEVQKLIASDVQAGAGLGWSLVLSDDVALMGAWGHTTHGTSGSVYQFIFDGALWIEDGELLPSDTGGQFGFSVAMDGNTSVVGANAAGVSPRNAGAAYVFDLNCGPQLSAFGACPGRMGFAVEGAEANARVAFLYARGEGVFEIPPGNPCAGTVLGLNRTVQLADVIRADAQGAAVLETNIPSRACGRYYAQAIDLTTCATTNVELIL